MYRQQVEVIIIPKFFKCLKFGYKSDYNISFKLIHQSDSGKKTFGFPFIHKSPAITKKKFRDERKQPKGDAETYQTQQFSVMFEDDDFDLHQMCVFKIEYNAKKLKRGKTYLEISLISHRNMFCKSEINHRIQQKIQRVHRQVFTKKLFINRIDRQISQFYQLDFTDNDYFGYLRFFVASAHLGWSLRRNNITLSQFAQIPQIERNKLTSKKEQKPQTAKSTGIYIKNIVKEYLPQFKDYYILTLRRELEEHERLMEIYESYCSLLNIETEFVRLQSKEQYQKRNLSEEYETNDVNEIYFYLFRESQQISCFNRIIWKQILSMIFLSKGKQLEKKMEEEILQYEKQWLSRTTVFNVPSQESQEKEKKNFQMKRKNILRSLSVYDDQDAIHPLLIFDHSQNTSEIIQNKIQNLVIFIHGYQGNRHDLEKASNYLIKYNPSCEVLLTNSLQNYPESTINEASILLSNQIKNFIIYSTFDFNNISIVGYSLGGVLARAILDHLQEYRNKFKILITFSSPHLGLESTQNQLVRAGIWYMTKFQKAPMISDMRGRDKNTCEKSRMKLLSEKKSLSWFEKVVLVSCRQDQFVPHPSSTISESSIDEQTIELSQNIKKNAKKIEKVEVWFDIENDTSTLDKWTGRRSHIQFLDNDKFLSKFFQVYAHQFS